MKDNISKVKHNGQVFTPEFLVKNILNYVGYTSGNILHKHIIDNSCGDGAFLCEITKRYCQEYIKVYNTTEGLKKDLETYIYGVELEMTAYINCISNLDAIATAYSLQNIKWKVVNQNALTMKKYFGIMDYVVGNPPYVRVHNLEDSYDEVKSFVFAQDGMTDLYLVFYELGLRMLNKKGKLCYITPSSWLSSVAGSKMRNYITIRKNLKELIDLEHFQAFKGATTYTMIALFDKTYCDDKIHYYVYSSKMKEKTYVDTLKHKEINIDGKFYLANKDALKVLKEIKTINVPATVKVKNGFATLADKIFITDYPYKKMSIRILKASTGEWHDGFFPYDENGKPVAKEEIFSDSDISQYLNKNKSKLLKAQSEEQNPNWYLYGRAQAINDVYSNKYAIGNIIKNKNTIKLEAVPVGSGVYSGLYILTDLPYDTIAAIINTDEFTNYIAMLKNYKSGGYYTYSSKDLEQYINFKLNK